MTSIGRPEPIGNTMKFSFLIKLEHYSASLEVFQLTPTDESLSCDQGESFAALSSVESEEICGATTTSDKMLKSKDG